MSIVEQKVFGPARNLIRLAPFYRAFQLVWAAILASVIFASPANAAPFPCSGSVYQVISGQLMIYDPISSSYQEVGANSGSNYNATGFNVLDGYAYGISGRNVIRIHSDGATETVYTLNSAPFDLPATTANAGDVDPSGNLWVKKTRNVYFRINLSDGSVTIFNITGSLLNNAADFVFMMNGSTPYLVAVENGNLGLIQIDTSTNTGFGTVSSISGSLPTGAYGAMWTDVDGRIFAFHNTTGNFYELANVFGTSPSGILAGTGVTTSANDGFSCANAADVTP